MSTHSILLEEEPSVIYSRFKYFMLVSFQDRQKVDPAVRILNPPVARALHSMDERHDSDDRKGMIFYLGMARAVQTALMGDSVPFLESIKMLWCTVFQLQMWSKWMKHKDNPYPNSQRRLALPSVPLYENLLLTGENHQFF